MALSLNVHEIAPKMSATTASADDDDDEDDSEPIQDLADTRVYAELSLMGVRLLRFTRAQVDAMSPFSRWLIEKSLRTHEQKKDA